jgi:hypothetical protein
MEEIKAEELNYQELPNGKATITIVLDDVARWFLEEFARVNGLGVEEFLQRNISPFLLGKGGKIPYNWPVGQHLPTKAEARGAVRRIEEDLKRFEEEERNKHIEWEKEYGPSPDPSTIVIDI